jgi:2-polyprenyl-3-methyl-5-hydroxy-6-metoxy-1,4-benzoquinol methylase
VSAARKVGFLTSLGVNVGDEFIREGIRAALDRTGTPYCPFYVHKLDGRSLSEPCEDEPFAVEDKYWDSDVFIQAGAPVYWHLLNGASTSLTSAWHEWMWNARILAQANRRHPIFVNLGAGSCQPLGDDGSSFLQDTGCADFALRAARRAAATTVRDPLAARMLKALDIPFRDLPCPAFLAAARRRIRPAGTGTVGVNLMPLAGHYRLDPRFREDAWFRKCTSLVHQLRKLGTLLFVAHDDAEAAFMARFRGFGERVFQSAAWRDYLDVYNTCSLVFANRVHGAVCAAGFGIPAVIVGNDSRASIGDYIGISWFPPDEPLEAILAAVALLHERRSTEAERLHTLREETLQSYTAILKPILKTTPHCGAGAAPARIPPLQAEAALGNVSEIGTEHYRGFMGRINGFAAAFEMRQFTNWSKVWEYPWLWTHGLERLRWRGLDVIDLGSEMSPMPWFLATLGARVHLIESDPQWIPTWERWQSELAVDIKWSIVNSESLPVRDEWADVVTSFSVIEHQPDKALAVREIARVLKPGGVLAMSFDICEPEWDMSFPAWNGTALTLAEFEELVWFHPAFGMAEAPVWNLVDIPAFIAWHLESAPHHRYTVGAAIMRKGGVGPSVGQRGPLQSIRRSRIADLRTVCAALEAYRSKHNSYPLSRGGWDGLRTSWGLSSPEWIPGLVPRYLRTLPRDPRGDNDPEHQYLYRSDGTNYKLISHSPDDIPVVKALRPELIDPARENWAYGFWTDGAVLW